MKSVSELYFEKQIILSIAKRDCSAQKRADLFSEFYRFGATYYEELCDSLYFLSSGEVEGALYITPSGKPYISHNARTIADIRLCAADELPPFHSDLCDQLTFSLFRLNLITSPKISYLVNCQ